MFKILIVDDEQIERDGIIFLIKKYKIELDVAEAENGEKALEYIKNNRVDILFTDIKMPFMDGFELVHHSREINPKLKTIIFSAYEEFDYARKAIDNKAISYILKPIVIEEFLKVIENVIKLCSDEEENEKKNFEIMEGYKKVLVYEKEKLLLDLINSKTYDNDYSKIMELTKLDLYGKNITMLLIDIQKRFFDYKNDEFKEILKELIKYDFEYLNLNEYQGVIFLCNPIAKQDKNELIKLGEKIKEKLEENYNLKPFLLFGKTVSKFEDIAKEFKIMEHESDLKYFYENDTVIFMSDIESHNLSSTEVVDNILTDIYRTIDAGDTSYSTISIKRLFDAFKNSGSYSFIYIKYVCADIIKKIIEKSLSNSINLKTYIEEVFAKKSMAQLEDDIINFISIREIDDRTDTDRTSKTVIKKVLDIIGKEYRGDLNLEYIAEKVYLTPSYLSYLFKKMSDQSLLKYITSYRLKKAEGLLDNTNMKIIDIGKNVGYPNLSYFCMLFKNSYGMTPAKYRERERKNENSF